MSTKRSNLDIPERELERLLAKHAEAGIPELVLVEVLRDYATTIETVGYIPRTWRPSEYTGNESSTGRKR